MNDRAGMESLPKPEEVKEFTLLDLLKYFLTLGTTGFGGPIALVGYMERDLVQRKGWITKEQYLRGLALAQLAPGPLAAQLAIYIGYLKGRIAGATLVGIAFVLPSFLMVVLLGMLYLSYGGLAWMQAVFYGVGAAIIGIIARSALRLTSVTLKRNPLLWGIALVMMAATAFSGEEFLWLFLLCGGVALLIQAPPRWFPRSARLIVPLPAIILSQAPSLLPKPDLGEIFLFFAKAGAFVFGSGLAIVPFLHGGLVQQHHWLNERQFLDAVAVAMITPGPVVITVGFIGYLVAGIPGAVVAALGVFLPVYLLVIVPAPYVERYAKNPRLVAFVEGVTSAATGAIAGAVILLGQRAVMDAPTAVIAAATFCLLLRYKIPEPLIIAAAGLIGLAALHFR